MKINYNLTLEKMDLRLHQDQKVRIITHDFLNEQNFIDVKSLTEEMGLMITNYTLRHQYIEIRKKESQIAILILPKKSIINHIDLGWWEDSEVIIAINEVEF